MTTEEKVTAVIELMESGESERSACETVGINRGTFRSAALRHSAADHYARGLTALANAQAEALEKTIDDMREGKIDAQMARVEIDARKWFASKFLPRQYGDKVALTGGSPDDAPIRTESKLDVGGLTDEQLRVLASIRVEK